MPGAELKTDVWIHEYFNAYQYLAHGVSQIHRHQRTAFQEMLIVESPVNGKALVLDGKWQTCEGDEILYHEPLIHVPCVLHGAPRKVLIAGGADGGALREALRWKTVEKVVMAEIDGEVIEACREFLPEIHQNSFDDPRAEIVVGDAFELIASYEDEWDVIIGDLTDPIEQGPAFKLFTREFFQHCRRAMRDGGIFVNQAGSSAPTSTRLLVRVVNTIGDVFGNVSLFTSFVPTYGSPWGFALASDAPLDLRPDPERIDAILRDNVEGDLKMFDGLSLLGLLQSPKYVRRQLEQEDYVYTLDAPPRFFGKGSAGEDAAGADA